MNATDVEIVARTLYGESRSEGLEGIAAVANVIQNRVQRPRWWGKDFTGVCRKKWQFSTWNEDDPNLAMILAVTLRNPMFQDCYLIARAAVAGDLRDRTKGADHYFADYIATPKWAIGKTPTVVIGRHRFYRIEK